MCTCRPVDHAFDDDIDQFIVPWRQNSPPEGRWPRDVHTDATEAIRAALEQAWDEGAHATEQHYKQTVLGHPGPVFSTVNPYGKGGKS